MKQKFRRRMLNQAVFMFRPVKYDFYECVMFFPLAKYIVSFVVMPAQCVISNQN